LPKIEAGEGATAPLVSIIMPTFNSSATVLRALASVCAQTYERFEVIIADDASKDDTAEKVRSFGDPRVHFLPSDDTANRGPAPTRNRALARAQGMYVAFIDSDDEWFPEKLATQVAYMESHPNCSIAVNNAETVGLRGHVVGTEFDSPRTPRSGADAWRTLLKYSFIETSSVMTRLALVRQVGGFDTALLVSQDQDLWIRLALEGETGIIDRILGRLNKLPTGHMSRNHMRAVDIMLPMIERHVQRLASRMSRAEIDEILGFRYQAVGRGLFLTRHYRIALRLLIKASRHNGNWLGNAYFIGCTNPMAMFVKRTLKRLFIGQARLVPPVT